MNLSMLLLTAPVGQRRTVLVKVSPTVQLVRDPDHPRDHTSPLVRVASGSNRRTRTSLVDRLMNPLPQTRF